MGGGDLNLKKSWHPSTLRNIERVWKAEQKHEQEKQKIEQLQKELAEERAREEIQTFAEDQGVIRKKEEKLDWMYQGPAAMVNRDEYLLGRKIDKTLETLQIIESGKTPEEDLTDVGASMFSSQNLSGSTTVDLANKIREDPLFNIMKKEKEQRKNLLSNPVKMKQLQQMLKASLSEKEKRKSKKNKKKKHQESNSEGEEVRHKKRKLKKHKRSDSEEEQIFSKETKNTSKKKHNSDLSPDLRADRHHSSYEHRHFSESLYQDRETKPRSRQEESQQYKRSHSYKNQEEEYYSEKKRKSSKYYHEDVPDRRDAYSHKEPSYRKSKHNGDSYHQENKPSDSTTKKKMDASERERLLKEMQENAKWWEEKRKKNTVRYREEDEKEASKNKKTPDFLKPILSSAAGKGSLENRVKQKIFSIQRNSSSMDKNFARRE